MSYNRLTNCIPTSISNGFCLATAISNLYWLVMWIVVSIMQIEVRDNINWYFANSLNFTQIIDVYEILRAFHFTLMILSTSAILSYNYYTHTAAAAICITQVLNAVTLSYNILFLVYQLTAGYIISRLVIISLPLLAVQMFHYIITLLFLFFILFVLTSNFCNVSLRKQTSLMLYMSVFLLTVITLVLANIGCTPCSINSLPAKPYLTAHRGCPFDGVPENSIAAFRRSASVPQVRTLESDIILTQDGVPVLLHDRTLFRTTSFAESCPDLSLLTTVFSLNYHTGQCPLAKLTLTGDMSQHVPTLEDLLSVAEEFKKNIMFDILLPSHNDTHYIITNVLESIVKSEINLTLIWWLESTNRAELITQYPQLTQVAQSLDEIFHSNNISIANEPWTLSLNSIKQIQSLDDVAINIFVIDSVTLFDYYWCVGVDSVTTNNCQLLNDHSHNYLYQRCKSMSFTLPCLFSVAAGIVAIYSIFLN